MNTKSPHSEGNGHMDKGNSVSEARKKANAKYAASAYDRIELKVLKGQKDIIKTHAEKYQSEAGEIGSAGYTPKGSVNGFIKRAIEETMQRDKNGGCDM